MRTLVLALLAGVVVAADQFTKHIIATTFMPGESRIVLPHVLYLTYVQNYHGAVVLVGFYLWYRREGATAYVHIAFALIFGGAVGNIIDRIRFGYVHDFIDF